MGDSEQPSHKSRHQTLALQTNRDRPGEGSGSPSERTPSRCERAPPKIRAVRSHPPRGIRPDPRAERFRAGTSGVRKWTGSHGAPPRGTPRATDRDEGREILPGRQCIRLPPAPKGAAFCRPSSPRENEQASVRESDHRHALAKIDTEDLQRILGDPEACVHIFAERISWFRKEEPVFPSGQIPSADCSEATASTPAVAITGIFPKPSRRSPVPL